MQLDLNSFSALQAIRALRCMRMLDGHQIQHVGPREPQLGFGRRWNAKRLTVPWLNSGLPPTEKHPLYAMVPSAEARIQARCVRNTVCSRDVPMIELPDGVRCVSPEHLFLEMGAYMDPAVHLMLGMELCGSYSRDPVDPRNADASFFLPPLTSAERIRDYVGQTHLRRIEGLEQARWISKLVLDNAWSPREALVAALIVLPLEELGFGLGPIVLNKRVFTNQLQLGPAGRESRVPDILFEGSHIGLNYEGSPHFGSEQEDETRLRIVADKLRDRDLIISGYTVLPVVNEDLAERGAFDTLMLQVMDLLEEETGLRAEFRKEEFFRVRLARRRQRLIWSLLPGKRGEELSREGVWATSADNAMRTVEVTITEAL